MMCRKPDRKTFAVITSACRKDKFLTIKTEAKYFLLERWSLIDFYFDIIDIHSAFLISCYAKSLKSEEAL